jgi:hypothetical protein
MQMGACCPAGRPYVGDDFTALYSLADLDLKSRQVAIHGDESLPMIDKNSFSIKEKIIDYRHHSIGRRFNRRPRRHGKIQP